MLTIQQLKQLEKYDWVYVVLDDHEGYYMKGVDDDDEFVPSGVFSMGLTYATYGKTWRAYKNKEEAEGRSIPFEVFVKMWSDIEGDDLPCAFGIFHDYVLKTNPHWCQDHIGDCNSDGCCWKKLIAEIVKE